MRIGVDPWPRIEFYVCNGLVKKRPTAEQLTKAIGQNAYASGMVERLKYYSRHPLELFPTDAKRQELLRVRFKASAVEIAEFKEPAAAEMMTADTDGYHDEIRNTFKPLSDRFLSFAFQFSPARFVVQCYYNPWHATTTSGLNVPLRHLIEHVVHAPAPSSLWDVQIIHPDPGGLDQLERAIDLAATGGDVKSRIYRALVQDLDYYDYLRDLVVRVRNFDYPPPPPNYNPVFENLVIFLNYAATL
jgi:hypothetical protein